MNVCRLTGNIEQDKEEIVTRLKEKEIVFVVSTKLPLYQYIEALELGNNALLKLRVCKELKGLDLRYEIHRTGEDGKDQTDIIDDIHCLSDLLDKAVTDVESYITVKGDAHTGRDAEHPDRKRTLEQLSEVIQQLIYLEIPIDRMQVQTEREMKDALRVQRFEKRLSALKKKAQKTAEALANITVEDAASEDLEMARKSMDYVQDALRRASDTSMVITVAASKKTGKSVIVNGMLRQELAPNAYDLPTPTNCIFKRSDIFSQTYIYAKGDHRGEPKGETTRFASAADLRKNLVKDFKEALANPTGGPTKDVDIQIGYVQDEADEGLTSYTIYDSPGPDFAAANVGEGDVNEHLKAAERAVEAADMAVFAIDYAKWLTDDEINYLKKIYDWFEQQGKRASLILIVNKLDVRYNAAGEKSVPRILDLIRGKLRDADPVRFRDCIVMGASALTYFDCLEAPRIPFCEALDGEDGLDSLDDCIEHYQEEETPDSDESMTVLNHLDEMKGRLKKFHGVKIHSLDELKNHSGMPSILSYVDYISRSKARVERVNHLMNVIDDSYSNIVNLFRFEELAQSMAEHQDKMNEARKLLEDFKNEVARIYDPKFPEIADLVEARQLESAWLVEFAQKTPFRFSDLCIDVERDIRKTLDYKEIVSGIVNQTIPSVLRMSVVQEHSRSTTTKRIDGVKRTLIDEAAIQSCLISAIKQGMDALTDRLGKSAKKCGEDAETAAGKTLEELERVLIKRQQDIKSAVEELQRNLREDANIPFYFASPTFDFAFSAPEKLGNHSEIMFEQSMKKSVSSYIKDIIEGKTIHLNSVWGKLKVIFSDSEKIDRAFYDTDYLMKGYEMEVAGRLYARMTQEKDWKDYQTTVDKFCSQVRELIAVMEKQALEQQEQAEAYKQKTQSILDHTMDYDNMIRVLESRKESLSRISNATDKFTHAWVEVRGEE